MAKAIPTELRIRSWEEDTVEIRYLPSICKGLKYIEKNFGTSWAIPYDLRISKTQKIIKEVN